MVGSKNKILIVDKFKIIGHQGPSACPLCKAIEENQNHIFLQSDYSHIFGHGSMRE